MKTTRLYLARPIVGIAERFKNLTKTVNVPSAKEIQKMRLTKVTVTGADDSVDPKELVDVQERYPFAEFGILVSNGSEGAFRFPSKGWMKHLEQVTKEHPLNLSCHLCGKWVRDLCKGEWSFIKDRPDWIHMFKRLQLNFHALTHTIVPDKFQEALKLFPNMEYIFQFDDINNSVISNGEAAGVSASPLFDISGGAGTLPEKWPKPLPGIVCGYAGGLSPENLYEQLFKIETTVAYTCDIWIDAETHLRSNNDRQFDIGKVLRFLEVAKPYAY